MTLNALLFSLFLPLTAPAQDSTGQKMPGIVTPGKDCILQSDIIALKHEFTSDMKAALRAKGPSLSLHVWADGWIGTLLKKRDYLDLLMDNQQTISLQSAPVPTGIDNMADKLSRDYLLSAEELALLVQQKVTHIRRGDGQEKYSDLELIPEAQTQLQQLAQVFSRALADCR